MMQEFEFMLWMCFCDQKALCSLRNYRSADAQVILSHLLNSAYYSKRHTSADDEFKPISAFFELHFPLFIGKHTEWLLLHEPEEIATPMRINLRYQ